MKTNQLKIDFSDGREIDDEFILFENIITDRGSRYSVSGGVVTKRDDVKKFLTRLKSNKKYAKATHNTFAVRISSENKIFETKSDDGETGAGNVLLRILQKENMINVIVVVTRWFGGIKLQNDRYKHVQDAARYFCKHV